MIKLLHGTCSCCAGKILKNGMNEMSCLTCNEDVASYYAEVACDDCNCGEEVILSVSVEYSDLIADLNSFNEPLTYFRKFYATSDENWHDMIESGSIPYPELNDFQTSLNYVTSAIHKSKIDASSISIF